MAQAMVADDREFMRGADISSLVEVEAAGAKFYNLDGRQGNLLSILKSHGFNWIRLRVWTRQDGRLVAEDSLKLARRAKRAGFKLLVDFHYSDTWADPEKQTTSAIWSGLDEKELAYAVEDYTRRACERFIAAKARPDAVQIGNELNNGFLWPRGKIWGAGEKIGGMGGFIGLLKAASRGVRAADKDAKIVIHLADGGDNALYRSIFDPLTAVGVDFDLIGLSFYPYWHGEARTLKANLEDLSARYGKKLVVVETAYAWTKQWGDGKTNVFPVNNEASVEIQRAKVREVVEAVKSVKGGAGVFYWEPAWLPNDKGGSPWENQALFDFRGHAIPSIDIW